MERSIAAMGRTSEKAGFSPASALPDAHSDPFPSDVMAATPDGASEQEMQSHAMEFFDDTVANACLLEVNCPDSLPFPAIKKSTGNLEFQAHGSGDDGDPLDSEPLICGSVLGGLFFALVFVAGIVVGLEWVA